MYKCARCRSSISEENLTLGINCNKCGNKIFIKARPNVKKLCGTR